MSTIFFFLASVVSFAATFGAFTDEGKWLGVLAGAAFFAIGLIVEIVERASE